MDKFGIYAVRDRLLDYFQQPFIATDTKAVQAALAELVNNQESAHAIAQAPQHFELFKIGAVTEDGHVYGTHELICECSALIRARLRNEPAPADSAVPQPVEGRATPSPNGLGHPYRDSTGRRPAEANSKSGSPPDPAV